MHRVDTGRRGPCLDCIKKLEDEAEARPEKPAEQPQLFEDLNKKFSRRSFMFLGALAAGAALTRKIQPPDETSALYRFKPMPAIPEEVWQELAAVQRQQNAITGAYIAQYADYYSEDWDIGDGYLKTKI
jgi:hypothetical protein